MFGTGGWSLLSLSSCISFPKNNFSHFSLAAREAREKLTVFVYLYLFHYYGGTILMGFVFLFTTMIELYFLFRP